MTDRKLLQQALEALKYYAKSVPLFGEGNDAIRAIRARLDQKDDEPVAWSFELAGAMQGKEYVNWERKLSFSQPGAWMGLQNVQPLYLHPPVQKNDEPVARVNSEGFIVEIGDLPIEEGSLLYLHPPAKQEPLTENQLLSEAAKMYSDANRRMKCCR